MTRRKYEQDQSEEAQHDKSPGVTDRSLYETLRDFPTRRELWLVVGSGLILGQTSSALMAIVANRTPVLNPQVSIEAIIGLFG